MWSVVIRFLDGRFPVFSSRVNVKSDDDDVKIVVTLERPVGICRTFHSNLNSGFSFDIRPMTLAESQKQSTNNDERVLMPRVRRKNVRLHVSPAKRLLTVPPRNFFSPTAQRSDLG